MRSSLFCSDVALILLELGLSVTDPLGPCVLNEDPFLNQI